MYSQPFIFRSSLRFRRLAHKGYAAFRSMHKEVTIGRLSAALCNRELLKAGVTMALSTLSLASMALSSVAALPPDSSTEAEQLTLQEVQVTASALLQTTARPVAVINHEQLLPLTISSVADVLRQLPDIDIRQRGPTGVQADISIRGCTADQTVVLLNGINLTDPQTGHYSMEMPLTGEEIERVEVYASTASALGAYAGVVNIITRQPTQERTTVQLSLRGGEYGYFAPAAALYHKKGELLSTTTVGYNQSTGFISNTDYRIANAFTHLQYKRLKWQAGIQYKQAGANAFYALAYPEQLDATRTAFTSFAYQHPFAKHWSLSVDAAYRAHFDRFELFREGTETPNWYTHHNRHTTHSANIDARIAYHTSWGTTTVGLTGQNVNIRSNTLGKHNRFILNYFAQQSVAINRFSATILVAGTYNNVIGSDWTLSLDMAYQPNNHWRIYANAARAIRLPNFTELYYSSKTQVSDPSLQPEHAVKAELGTQMNYHQWQASLTAFYRFGTNTIDWIQPLQATDERWYSKQLTDLHTVGGTASVAYQPTQPLAQFIKQIRAQYTYLYMDKPKGDFLSKYALDHLSHNASFTLDHVIYRSVGACWQLQVQDRHGSYLNRDGQVAQYKTVWLLSGKVYYDYRWQTTNAGRSLRLSLECTNMLNRSYYDIGGILQPPHWVKAHIAVTL